MDEAWQIVEAVVSDDTDSEDEDAVAARWNNGLGEPLTRWNNGLAAKLGNGGVILVLAETKNGFAIFMYDGIKLLKEDAHQNIWVDFAEHTVAKRTVWLLEYHPFDPKELMWGLKIQMPYLVPAEKSMLDEKDCFLIMSKGMKQLLNRHGFILELEDMKVTRHIINLAGVVHMCDSCVKKHDYSLRSAAEHLKRISRIDTQEWI
ncbi:hypothetical protein BDA96_01G439500 [Sorghum bicolor]|uniref:Uncharacterized protein n=1 Tax=Sorghum bicolor TaxID=4558 RepID=A0A921S5H1_SORBI|nr:hypothetical protein BDA96_01G439500 [Sorghum bicolor]